MSAKMHHADTIAPRLTSLCLGAVIAMVGLFAILFPGHANTSLYRWMAEWSLTPAFAWLRLIMGLACFSAAVSRLYLLRWVCDGMMALVLSALAASMTVAVTRDFLAGHDVNPAGPIVYTGMAFTFILTASLNARMDMELTRPRFVVQDEAAPARSQVPA